MIQLEKDKECIKLLYKLLLHVEEIEKLHTKLREEFRSEYKDSDINMALNPLFVDGSLIRFIQSEINPEMLVKLEKGLL